MLDQVRAYIEKKKAPMVLFVLKGFSVESLCVDNIYLKDTIENKISRLLILSQQEQPAISFDEFTCLFDIAVMQFKKIYIIENPLYHNLFPVGSLIDDDLSTSLLAHYDEDADEKSVIGILDEYTNIYSKYVRTAYGIACCYGLPDNHLLNGKIEIYRVPLKTSEILQDSDASENLTRLNICDDIDFYELVQQLQASEDKVAVTWENFSAGKDVIESSLYRLNFLFPNRLCKSPISVFDAQYIRSDAVKAIMKRYWGYEEYRDIKIYDLAAAEQKQKRVVTISQEQIVSDLIKQTENCIQGNSFQDIFVTAPTGSGKSLMFQLPAIYLAEKHNLVTLIISPLIGLMNDQVQALERHGYQYAKTINGDIPPVIKQEILEDVKNCKCHILYLSPESLLARNDIEQLIGSRKIGMVIVDEAHIVTTWGKQFRPDYWFLGDHVQKILRAQQKKEDSHAFVIATFTATAIYEGDEDMYHETLNSLHMHDPITYLGYVKRDNISIEISNVEVKRNKTEYELNKFDDLIELINAALMRGQKTLIYFPTVALITRFYGYCCSKNLGKYIARYHGQLMADERANGFHDFLDGTKLIMLATKAFGMGIDIKDITIVAHFAPTGNVCDYMQEIGRAARDSKIAGHAIYKHMSNDFKHINRLHGLSAIRKYQLLKVMDKILEIHQHSLQNRGNVYTKRRNEMLIDAESFSYIFESPNPNSDENEIINKVKTTLLLIQKDYENQIGFSPFYMRPIPLFKNGYFVIDPDEQASLNQKYPSSVKNVYESLNICEVDLNKIWERSYKDLRDGMSFPRFKFLLYTGNEELDFTKKYHLSPAMEIRLYFNAQYEQTYNVFISAFKKLLNDNALSGKYIYVEDMISEIQSQIGCNRFQSEGEVNVFLAAMDIYQREFTRKTSARIYRIRETQNAGKVAYSFDASIRDFFSWLDKGYRFITDNVINEKIYIINNGTHNRFKEILVILGVLESAAILRFRSLGGSQSQIYIYVNSTRALIEAKNNPQHYRNRLLELIEKRHADSVRMLTFLFQGEFSSDEIWNHMENYFLGIIPEELKTISEVKAPKKIPLPLSLLQ